MPPDVVIRSSGIWNSRAPFDRYIAEYKKLNRSYALATLAALKLQRDLESAAPQSVRGYFYPRKGRTQLSPPRLRTAWSTYRKALGRDRATGAFRTPSAGDVIADTDEIVNSVRRSTLVGHVSLFETYLQTWTLNYLLAKLETRLPWSNEDRYLACRLSPVHSGETEPSAAFILRCLPALQAFLRGIVPYFKDPFTGASLTVPSPPNLNALEAIKFWISLRNICVHQAGWVSPAFASKYSKMWEYQFGGLNHIPPLKGGRAVLLFHEVTNRAALNLYRTALALSDELERLSNGRRGQPWSPLPRQISKEGEYDTPTVQPLLVDGDHPYSLRWTRDPEFRERFVSDNLP